MWGMAFQILQMNGDTIPLNKDWVAGFWNAISRSLLILASRLIWKELIRLSLSKSKCFTIYLATFKSILTSLLKKRPIEIGIPQGSPISPILFLIYVSELFKNRSWNNIRTPSYIDDIALIVSSPTVEENCKKLQTAVQELFHLQSECCTQFDLNKSDLIHFFSENLEEVKFTSELILKPKNVVRWLGVWLDTKLLFKFHVEKKVADAEIIIIIILHLRCMQSKTMTPTWQARIC